MRIYYIFFQQYKLLNADEYDFNGFFHPKYTLLPWEYYGYVIGTKSLYESFKNVSGYHHIRKCCWVDSLDYEPNKIVKHEGIYRGIIIDDSGNVRDFYELTKKYHHYYWKCNTKHHKGYHWHAHSFTHEMKHSLTPQDKDEIKHNTCMHIPDIPSDMYTNGWDNERFTVSGGSWKDQSKKRKQYGNHAEKLSKKNFEKEIEETEKEELLK